MPPAPPAARPGGGLTPVRIRMHMPVRIRMHMPVRIRMHMPVRIRMHMQARIRMHMQARIRMHMQARIRMHMPVRIRMHMLVRIRMHKSADFSIFLPVLIKKIESAQDFSLASALLCFRFFTIGTCARNGHKCHYKHIIAVGVGISTIF